MRTFYYYYYICDTGKRKNEESERIICEKEIDTKSARREEGVIKSLPFRTHSQDNL
jgi:hypothetical protein